MFAFLLSALKTQSLQQTICLVSLIAQIFLAFLVVRPSIDELPLGTMPADFRLMVRDGRCRWPNG